MTNVRLCSFLPLLVVSTNRLAERGGGKLSQSVTRCPRTVPSFPHHLTAPPVYTPVPTSGYLTFPAHLFSPSLICLAVTWPSHFHSLLARPSYVMLLSASCLGSLFLSALPACFETQCLTADSCLLFVGYMFAPLDCLRWFWHLPASPPHLCSSIL